ncbi:MULTISPECIES: hypothetical protein [Burkholderia]|nr:MULTISPECIES: hypothetical protein [Burkholderia cepacia complex]MBR8291115.1 hypothetical protein [Burkholderia cenocepacia]MDK0996905.1 hypothetical protein [Burkholderia contaminans]
MSLPLKPQRKTKRIHLATERVGRWSCRYTSRSNAQVRSVPLAEFLRLPVECRCMDCSKVAEVETGEVIHTFETTFYDPLLKSLREFYESDESGNQGFEVVSGEDYMRQLTADMNKRDAVKPG